MDHSSDHNDRGLVFDYKALRFLMGIIALALPFVVSIISSISLPSVSASYYTEARDLFVGLLFVVASFLWAYNGHSRNEIYASDVAAIAATLVAIFPTKCDTCTSSLTSIIHYFAAVILFSILAYFCFVPFQKNTRKQKGKKGRRSKIYLLCGSIMILCMVVIALANFTFPSELVAVLRVTYWGEAIALGSFGVAWIVSGKPVRLIADEDERLKFRDLF